MKKAKKTFVIIGAGPTGLSAGVHVKIRGVEPLILEKVPSVGSTIESWEHVAAFTPWRYVMDIKVTEILKKQGWKEPADLEHLPRGREIIDQYLKPVAQLEELQGRIQYNAEVIGVSKAGYSKLHGLQEERNKVPFRVHYKASDGTVHVVEADGVIDASGTLHNPNPIGVDGLPVLGEQENKSRIFYGIPHAEGKDKATYKGKTTMVLGGGHSAIGSALGILKLKEEDINTKVIWGLRSKGIEKLLGGGINDELPARGAIGQAAKKAIDDGALELLQELKIERIEKIGDRLRLDALVEGEKRSVKVDSIVVNTGFRPNLHMLSEVRLALDPAVEAPKILAPLVDSNFHSCGTVKPHGVDELSHPDKNFFMVGMKSYGRSTAFLMLTGYEQVRSIADEIVGNHKAARIIELNLPETGVCKGCEGDEICSSKSAGQNNNTPAASGCCTAQQDDNACSGNGNACSSDGNASSTSDENTNCDTPCKSQKQHVSSACCG